MQLDQFLQQLMQQSSSVALNHPVIAFYGSEYPLLLMSKIVKIIANSHPRMLVSLNMQEQESSAINAQLQTTFLGQNSSFWLADSLGQISRPKQQEWLSYLQHYKGPNTVLLFVTGEPPRTIPTSWQLITIPDSLSRELILAIVKLHQTTRGVKIDDQFVRQLLAMGQQLTLDQLCLLLQYSSITVGGSKEFFNDWVPHLVTPEQSLFTLSQHLFARKTSAFFTQWSRIKDNYMAPFWISFWSDQLWRAAYFIEYSKEGNAVEAKKMSYKLPFSFIQRDWKLHSVQELRIAHELLYDLDGKSKNGGDAVFLEYFYVSFFKR